MSSSGCPLLNDAFPDPMHPSAPEEIEAQGRADKNTDKHKRYRFNRIDNIVSLINSETRDDELVILPRTACLKIFVSISMKEVD
ncbi:hypothetical protein TNCV_2515061 [Trichonephila clavipes]|nr:hypothetical protein TNCV_2515061 [Trichonephila clavipes]